VTRRRACWLVAAASLLAASRSRADVSVRAGGGELASLVEHTCQLLRVRTPSMRLLHLLSAHDIHNGPMGWSGLFAHSRVAEVIAAGPYDHDAVAAGVVLTLRKRVHLRVREQNELQARVVPACTLKFVPEQPYGDGTSAPEWLVLRLPRPNE
jgi:hypothetical protein